MSFCVLTTPDKEKFIEKQRNKLKIKSKKLVSKVGEGNGKMFGFGDDNEWGSEDESGSKMALEEECFYEMDFGNRIWSLSLFPFYSVATGMECAAVSVKNHPLKLVNLGNTDAAESKSETSYRDSGNVAFTYSTKDHFDEVSSPFSTAFNLNGSHLYCGFMDNNFQVFDINYRDPIVNTNLSPTRKSKDGLKGILSCISFNPDYSGIYAVGSFSGGIGLYDERNNDRFFILDSTSTNKRKGVSSVSFSPCGNYLYSRYRESTSPAIQVWDIRSSQKVVRELVLAPRSTPGAQSPPPPQSFSGGKSNQRLGFSVDRETGLVAAGFHDGRVGVWSLGEEKAVLEFDVWKGKKYSVACHSVHLLDSTSPALSYVSTSRRMLEMEGQETRSPRSSSSALLSLACFFQERVFLDNDQDEDGLGHVKDEESIYYEKGATVIFTNL